MKRYLFLAPVVCMLLTAVGCSDDDDKDPTGPGDNQDTATTTWDEEAGTWRTVLDASDYESFKGYSFVDRDTVTASGKVAAWDIAFRREVVKLNGGASGSGDLEGADLGAVDYDAVTDAAAAGADWESDAVEYFIDNWYDYNPQTHELTLNRNVYSMLDASGEHYVKFRVDSLSGDLGMGRMGNVHLTYYYQANANDRRLGGETQTAVVAVGAGTGYFDFSTGQQVTPADPKNSLDWDIWFNNFNLAQNCGPNGVGECAAFWAFSALGQAPSDIDAFTEQPAGIPLFPDIQGSVLTDWYDYKEDTHQLVSWNRVYLLRSGDRLYKMKIVSYYANVGGQPKSAVYTFVWNEL